MTVLEFLEANIYEYVSGESIAQALDMTRANVWKEITKLRDLGIVIEAKTRKGYRIEAYGDYISAGFLKDSIPDIQRVEVFDSCTSTNDLAKEGLSDLYVSQHQSNGRGRRGRSFISPQNKGLYFSLNLYPKIEMSDIPLLTLCAAVAVRQVLQHHTKKPVGIKWLNDLMIDNKKICGILVEGDLELQTQTFNKVTVGIGINLYESDEHDYASLDQYSSMTLNKHLIIAETLKYFYYFYDDLELRKDELIKVYQDHSIVIGKKVRIDDIEYLACSITDQGHLEVEDEHGVRHTMNSGEVSIVL